MKGLDAVLDIQPQFLSTDLPWALDFLETPPPYIFPWKTLLEAGLIQAGSSDAPVEIPNPLLGIHAAIFRKSDHDNKIYQEGEKLSYFEAISLYTKGANYPTYHHNRGFLKKGFIADLTMFTQNLFTLHENEFKKDLVYMTVVDEHIVYTKQ
jgi:predicted amidohydrolase YtcJ